MGKSDESSIVKQARTAASMSLRDFAEWLNENIPDEMGTTTFMSVSNWEKGRPVTSECLMAWKVYYPVGDPRHTLAIEIFRIRASKVEDPKDRERILSVIR